MNEDQDERRSCVGASACCNNCFAGGAPRIYIGLLIANFILYIY